MLICCVRPGVRLANASRAVLGQRVDRARLARVGPPGEGDLGQRPRGGSCASLAAPSTNSRADQGMRTLRQAASPLAGRARPLQWRAFSTQSRVRRRLAATPDRMSAGSDTGMDRTSFIAALALAASRLSSPGWAPGTPPRRARPSPISPRPSRPRRQSAPHATAPTATAPSRRIRTSPGRARSISAASCAHFKAGIRVNADHAAHRAAAVRCRHGRRSACTSRSRRPRTSRRQGSATRRRRAEAVRGGDAASGVPACAACHSPTGAGIPKNFPQGVGPVRRLHLRAAQGVQVRRARQRRRRQGCRRPHHGRIAQKLERHADEGARRLRCRLAVAPARARHATPRASPRCTSTRSRVAAASTWIARTLRSRGLVARRRRRPRVDGGRRRPAASLPSASCRASRWSRVDVTAAGLRLSAPHMRPMRRCRSTRAGAARDVVVWRSTVLGSDMRRCRGRLDVGLARARRAPRALRSRAHARVQPRVTPATRARTRCSRTAIPSSSPTRRRCAELNERLAARGHPALPMNRFRPNVVIDGLARVRRGSRRYHRRRRRACCGSSSRARAARSRRPTRQPRGSASSRCRTLGEYRMDAKLDGVTFGVNAIVVEGEGRSSRPVHRPRVEYRF